MGDENFENEVLRELNRSQTGISTQIARISGNVSDALTAIAAKGVTVPQGANSDDLADLIASIASGGGMTVTDVPNSTGTGSVISGEASVLGTKTITANGTYLASDDDADGYSSVTVNVSGGGSSGLVYETGTYTAAADERPEISFANSHSTAPDILIFADASASAPSTGNALSAYCHFNYQSLFGAALATPTAQNAAYGYGRLASNLNYASALINDTTSNVTSSGFKPFAGTTAFTCKSGQTYKWIAIWK